MGTLSIKLKRYNEGGFMSPYSSNELDDWYASDQAKGLNADSGLRAGAGAVGSALMKVPSPYTQAAGAVLQLGNIVDKASKDQYGIYKSKAAEVADNVLDPINHIKNMGSAFQDVFSGHGRIEDVGNALSFGLLGSSKSQREAERQKRIFENNRNLGMIRNATNAGAAYDFSTPQYQAPAYGRRGIKLPKPGGFRGMTRFSVKPKFIKNLKPSFPHGPN